MYKRCAYQSCAVMWGRADWPDQFRPINKQWRKYKCTVHMLDIMYSVHELLPKYAKSMFFVILTTITVDLV
jgi:hypothetical protein